MVDVQECVMVESLQFDANADKDDVIADDDIGGLTGIFIDFDKFNGRWIGDFITVIGPSVFMVIVEVGQIMGYFVVESLSEWP